MKKLITILPVFFLLSCEKKENNCPTNTYTYTAKLHSKIDSLKNADSTFIAVIADGNNMAFKYLYEHTECKNVEDGDGGQELIFEVLADKQNFSFDKADFETIKCYYRSFAEFGLPQFSIHPEDGTIEGTKLNSNTWKVTIDIKINSNHTIRSSENYLIK